jgi:beta-glucosidase-like glycosyl hydrolase
MKKKIAQLIIARLDGNNINKKFNYYASLVKTGIGGFIVFGGNVKDVKTGIKELQKIADIPLFIAADLEQGLGQQVNGGTLFPPALAVGNAINKRSKSDISLLKKSIEIVAKEAKTVGINVIFVPVLDVNTNKQNPIICTRAFSESARKVAWFGENYIKGIQQHGLFACAKHFPGHGDTSKDSHIELPVVHADINRLSRIELQPFKRAVKTGVKMIMVGHLLIPALDAHMPTSLSEKVINGLLKQTLRFKGLVITDAMNMNAVSHLFMAKKHKNSEAEACRITIRAGADMLLHPDDPLNVIHYLDSLKNDIEPFVERSYKKIINAKKGLRKILNSNIPINRIGTRQHWKTAETLTIKSIRIRKKLIRFHEKPVVLIIDDDNTQEGKTFLIIIKKRYPEAEAMYIDNKSNKKDINAIIKNVSGRTLIGAVFSKVSAWKGRSGMSEKLQNVLNKAASASAYSVVAGFCCPYMLHEVHADTVIEAYHGSKQAQQAVGRMLTVQ